MNVKIKYLVEIRHFIHAHPELSCKEISTAKFIIKHLEQFKPQTIISGLGGNGVAAVYDSQQPGFTLCFRADLDALPISENSSHSYISNNPGVSHACGHDGHATCLIAFAQWLSANPGKWTGKVILLFQPAEEIAEGALAVLADERFTVLNPDFIFGMHNIPGYPLNALIIRDKVFASASCGLKVKLIGKTSHAGHPEDGNSPMQAMIAIMQLLTELPLLYTEPAAAALITVIHVRLGEEAFGTSPGDGEIMATFRANHDEVLHKMTKRAETEIKAIATAAALQCEIKWVEKFAATVNATEAYTLAVNAATKAEMQIIMPSHPFSWSEDFSFYGSRYKCCFFGLGAGETHPQLHNPDYDFPDELIPTALNLYASILAETGEQYATLELD
ncbi:MAG: amidohydrolase [Candidatus Cloacimonetes bacterium]|nr:amidohydrolase [Candidatus Cloacimonadota bacterium]